VSTKDQPGARARTLLWASGLAAAAGVALARVRGKRPAVVVPATTVAARAEVTVRAGADVVFAQWRRLDRLPRLLRHLTAVERLRGDRYRFRVVGPGGPLAWEASVNRYVPGAVIAWQSAPGAPVEQQAVVELRQDPRGGTRLSVALRYRAADEAQARTLRWMMGARPDVDLGADLLRFKLLVEAGKLAAA
jgi:uncharacterized membrane protein